MIQLNRTQIIQAAQILTDSIPAGWPTLQHALDEIHNLLPPENTLLAAIEDGSVLWLGWYSCPPTYNGNVFEIHPLVVRSDKRKQGIGRAIVKALEDEARKKGGLTIYVGADDGTGDGETSLANVDLYDDLPGKVTSFFSWYTSIWFYLKLGYKIIGGYA